LPEAWSLVERLEIDAFKLLGFINQASHILEVIQALLEQF
jgi:hypothetical protein